MTPTVENSRECPSEPFSTEDLDPQWALVCAPCLPAAVVPTSTPGGVVQLPTLPSFSIPTINFSTFTPVPATVTPTSSLPTATATYTPTATTTPEFLFLQFDLRFDDDDDDVPYAFDNPFLGGGELGVGEGYVGNGGRSTNPVISTIGYVEPQFPIAPGADRVIDNFSHRYKLNGTSVANRLYLLDASGNILEYSIDYGLIADNEWHQFAATGLDWEIPDETAYLMLSLGGGGDGSQMVWVDNIRVVIEYPSGDVTPTPSPTATTTPGTPTPTLDPFAVPTYDRTMFGFIIIDCRVPKYADHSPAVDVDVTPSEGSNCYRLIPPIDNDTLVSIHQPAIDLCLQFYQVTFNVMGVVIDIPLLVSVAFALFVFRWALFGG